MPDRIDIVPALQGPDLQAARDLCNAFLAWLRTRYATVDDYYPQSTWNALLEDLPAIHAPPEGGIWLARDAESGTPLGTVMLKAWTRPGSCEMKRLFVHADARRRGIGQALALHAVAEARKRGYDTMVFDTGVFHTEAMALYRRLGFTQREPYYEVPEALRDQLVFFEGRLDGIRAAG